MGDKLRVGIAGYGVVGKRRRSSVDAHPQLRTVAVCDRAFERDGVFEDGVRFHRNYRALLDEDLDILLVCLTNDISPDVTIAGLTREIHVFCEKPPGRNVEDIVRVIDAERQHPRVKLKYGFNHRYHHSVRDALEIMRSGKLGRVLNMRGVYGKSQFVSFGQSGGWRTSREIAGGGILLDQGIHMVDLMRLFGGEFNEVHSYVSNGFWRHDVEDNAYALMRSDLGVVALLHSSATQWRHRFTLDIALERGALVLSGILSGSKSYGAETLTVITADESDQGDPVEQTTRYNKDPSWQLEIDEFASAVLHGTAIVNGSSEEALRSMELVYRIYRADPAWRDKWKL